MRLNPRYPPWVLIHLGWAYRSTGRYEEAITTLKTLLREPQFSDCLLSSWLAATWCSGAFN